MSDNTTVMLFQSDIVANVDVAEAEAAINRLAKSVDKVDGAIKASFGSLDRYLDRFGDTVRGFSRWVEEAVDSVQRADGVLERTFAFEEQEKRIVGLARDLEYLTETVDSQRGTIQQLNQLVDDYQNATAQNASAVSNSIRQAGEGLGSIFETTLGASDEVTEGLKNVTTQADLVTTSVKSVMKLFTGGVKVGAAGFPEGESLFTKDVVNKVQQAVADVKGIWTEAGLDVQDYSDIVIKTIESMANEISIQARKRGLGADDVIAAWKKAFDVLVGHSIIPDLVSRMEQELVDRAGRVLGDHADMVKDSIFPWDEKRADVLARGFAQVIKRVEREQLLFNTGLVKSTRSIQQIMDGMLDPMIDDWDNYLRKWREMNNMSKFTTLTNVQKAIQGQGLTTVEVIRKVDKENRSFAQSLIETEQKIGSAVSSTVVSVSSSVALIPARVNAAISNMVIGVFNKIPYSVAAGIQRTAREVEKLSPAFAEMGAKLAVVMYDPIKRPPKDVIAGIVAAFKPLAEQLGNVGEEAAGAMIEAMKVSVTAGSAALVGSFKFVGDAIVDQFRYVGGKIFDALTFQGKESKLLHSIERAESYGMGRTFERLEEERIKLGIGLKNSEEETRFLMQSIDQSVSTSLKNVGLAFANLFSRQLTFREGLGGLATAFRQTTRSAGLFEEKADGLGAGIVRTLERMQRSLSGYGRTGEIVDKDMNRLASSVDTMSNRLKEQAQIFTKLAEEERKSVKQRIQALGEYMRAYQAVLEVEKMGAAATAEQRAGVAQELQKAAIKIADLGMFEEVFGGMGEDMDALKAKIETFGSTTGATLSTVFGSTKDRAISTFSALDDQFTSMTRNYPKQLSMISRAVQDVEGNSKHFITTLRDGGKISTERLQDMRLALEDLYTEMQKAGKLRLLQPEELKTFWQDMSKNILLESENFQLLAQRALVVNRIKEGIHNTTKKVAQALGDVGKAAITHLPLVGQKARMSGEDLEKMHSAIGRVRGSGAGMSMVLANLDPVFTSIGSASRVMGQNFSAAMDGMRQVAEVKGGSIIKTLTMMRLAAMAVIGVFTSIIVSTGKLASEVTTLGITMKVVAQNTGYNVKQMEGLVDVLKETGITTRESLNALTQFMRAKLPLAWDDPIQKASFTIKDLARSAQSMAVAVGEDSSATFSRFIDFITTGNSQLLNQVGIMKNASNMLEEYAKAVGKTVKSLTQRERYEALISGLMQEASKVQGVYTEAMKTASKQLGSMKRYMEEMRLEWGKHFEPIVAMVIFRFNQLLEYLTKVPESTKKAITSFVAIATAISGMVIGLSFLLPKLAAFVGILKPAVGLLFGKFGLLLAVVGLVAKSIGGAFMKIEAESDGVAGIIERVNSLLDSFGGISGTLDPLIRWFKSLFGMIKYHLDAISYRVRTFFGEIGSRVQGFLATHPEIAAFLSTLKTVIGDLFTTIWKVIDKVLDAVERLLDGDWQGFFDDLKRAGMLILTWLVEFFNEVVKEAFEWGKTLISTFVGGLVAKAREIIPSAMSSIGNMIAMFLEGHSPPKAGPLTGIIGWGQNIMSAFDSGLRSKGLMFDEDMFMGLSSLGAKARKWGDNITEVFTAGIIDKAKGAVPNAMGVIGSKIAMFLEGHSPPTTGKLAEIEDWGRNVFEAFLAGFEMADFDILDRGVDLIRQHLEMLVGDAESAAGQISAAMIKVREVIAQAIFQARSGGGALDLSALRDVIVGTLTAYAQDIATLLEAMFASLQAEEAYNALQEQIEAARKARSAAIEAAQERLEAIQDEIEGIQDEIEALEKQIEKQVETQLAAAGLVVDERLMNELQRQLADANTEISRAQRRLSAVRGQASKYGQNILTWEEINAQAQLDLAEDRRDQIQDEIDVQEEIQREAERIRDQLLEQYQSQFDALNAQLEAAQVRAEQAQAQVEALQKANEAATKAENDQLAAAQKHAADLKANADLLAKLLEQRMKMEEDRAKLIDDETKDVEANNNAVREMLEKAKQHRDRVMDRDAFSSALKTVSSPEYSGIFGKWRTDIEKWLNEQGLSIKGGLPGLVDGIKKKVEAWWDSTLGTPIGDFLRDIDTEGLVNSFGLLGKAISDAWKQTGVLLGNIWYEINKFTKEKFGADVWGMLGYILKEAAGVLSEIVQMTIDLVTMLTALLSGNWDVLGEAALKFVEDAAGLVGRIFSWFGISGEEILEVADTIRSAAETTGEWLGSIFDSIGTFFSELPGKIGEWLAGVWDAITKPFIDAYNFLIGNSLIPDLIGGVVDWFTSLPGELLKLVSSIFNSAITIGQNLFDGVFQKAGAIATTVAGWFGAIPGLLIAKAVEFWTATTTLGTNAYTGFKAKIDEIILNVGTWFSTIGTNIAAKAQEMFTQAGIVASQIWTAFNNAIFGKEGLLAKIGGWITSVAERIGADDILNSFKNVARSIGTAIIDSIKSGISAGVNGLVGLVKGIWNDHLRKSLQGVLDNVGGSINDIINIMNTAASAIGYSGWPFPIPNIDIPKLPSLDVGGIIMKDIMANLHAGEIVLPLDRLPDIMRGIGQPQQVPAFAPTLQFYGSTTPGQVMGGISQAYDWYLEQKKQA